MQKIFKKSELFIPEMFQGCTDKSIKPFQRCSRSHIALIQKAKDINMPFIVVFEDDAYPCIDCKKKFELYLNNIPIDANMLILGWSNCQKGQQNFSKRFNKVKTSTICGSHAYILMRNAYDKYIKYMTNNPNATADTNIYYIIENTYILDKPLFIQYSQNKSMNNHIGYIYYGNHQSPPNGFQTVNKLL